MAINAAGLDLIKRFEGLRTEAYDDGFGTWTIGYGHTAGVVPGQRITPAEAERMLADDLTTFEARVRQLCTAPPNSNQLAAMTSLAFNIGVGAFQRSTALRKHNAGDTVGAAEAFKLFRRAGGREVPGLLRRRNAEAALYLTPVNGDAPGVQTVDPEVAPLPTATPDNNRGPIANLAAQIAAAVIALSGVAEPFRNALDTVGLGPLAPYIALACAALGIGLAGVWLYRRIKSRQAVTP